MCQGVMRKLLPQFILVLQGSDLHWKTADSFSGTVADYNLRHFTPKTETALINLKD
jgi:hypothetical protein